MHCLIAAALSVFPSLGLAASMCLHMVAALAGCSLQCILENGDVISVVALQLNMHLNLLHSCLASHAIVCNGKDILFVCVGPCKPYANFCF